VALIGIEESMTLEFKRGDLLDKEPNKIAEALSRGVSGLANAIGGRIIIGMVEEKNGKRGIAHALTGVADPEWTAHRLHSLSNPTSSPRCGCVSSECRCLPWVLSPEPL
jgi:predicted HTH transcriptional regulator